jgi:GNAT superfamily N-acetyltransferase
MDFLDILFKPKLPNVIPLQKKRDIEHEVKFQTMSISDAGFKVLDIFHREELAILLYRHFYEDTLREEEDIILKIRIITKKGVLYPEPNLKAFFINEFTKIELADIDIKEQFVNDGYGSILLGKLIELAVKRNVREITGWISGVDKNHIERLVHFYEKHGFQINLHDRANTYKIGDLIWLNNFD